MFSAIENENNQMNQENLSLKKVGITPFMYVSIGSQFWPFENPLIGDDR